MKHDITWAEARTLYPQITMYMPTWKDRLPVQVVSALQASDTDQTIRPTIEKSIKAAVQGGALGATKMSAVDYLGSDAHLNVDSQMVRIDDKFGRPMLGFIGVSPVSESEVFDVISSSDFESWLSKTGVPCSTQVDAWISELRRVLGVSA